MNDAAPAIRPVDLSGIDAAHPEGETTAHRIGVAAAETAAGVTGVHRLGGAAARALDAASRAIRGTSTGPGVTVSEEDGRTVIDLDLVVEYPTPVQDVVDETREQVARAARQIAPGPVRVDIRVTDVHGPFDDAPSPAAAALEGAEDAGSELLEKARDAGSRLREEAEGAGSEAVDRAKAVGAVLADSARADAEETRDAAAERAEAGAAAEAADFDTYGDASGEPEASGRDASAPEVTVIVEGHGGQPTRIEVDGPATVEVQGERVAVDGDAVATPDAPADRT
ncbi:putative alkaline shock family protein YloU/vacuolar-type H+-ATPase subunit H [Clavibacter sp. B3I6]|uniref:Asp23/Gls24 family envelope stress response protein n=1 Tax=Clavibacter sp. B3I6 TaxID=3042268 RepID=UPI00277DD18F|nr:Asp23/Gls24 family envelope stress response protein [Clavibacter sp. B3I6]MDQ0744467.1 putative alkaline shock family protein YloU/vacuolar-type H+-ATPase subunit H [Clavibacter sp. B3I6]